MTNSKRDSSKPPSVDAGNASQRTDRAPLVPYCMAEYIPSNDPMHTGNPFIDTLPAIRPDSGWTAQLLRNPTPDSRDRELDGYLRSYKVVGVKRLLIPTARHIQLARRFDQIIRWGYEGRNPLLPERMVSLQETYARAQRSGKAATIVFSDSQPICTFGFIGCSGTGKSTTAEAIVASIPQCIYHERYGITQVVWLKVDCPKDGSVGDLALSILRALDKVLKTTHAIDCERKKLNASRLAAKANHLANAHHVGVLILDEMQNLSVKKSGGREEMLNWFQELVNDIKLPIILLGTYKMKSLLPSDLRHARRAGVLGSMTWDPLTRGQEFDFLLENIWRYCVLRDAGELTEELRQVIYDETQGIRAFMVDMFVITQLHALVKGKEKITPELFRTVARTEFASVQPMIKALRDKDHKRIQHFADLTSYNMDVEIERLQHLTEVHASKAPVVSSPSMMGVACESVMSFLDISDMEARQLILSVTTGSEKTSAALAKAAIKRYFEMKSGPADSIEGEAA
jgi:hypothetical protein